MTVTKDIKAYGPYLVSENPPLYLSAVEMSDIPELVRTANLTKDVYNGTATFQYPFLEEHARSRIEQALKNHAKGYNTHLAMRTAPDGPFIGWIAFHFSSKKIAHEVSPETGEPLKVAEFGYWVSAEHTRKGYTKRSARYLVQEILFKEFDCNIVKGEAYRSNIASRKVLEGAGLKCMVESRIVYIPKLEMDKEICCYAAYKDAKLEEAMVKAEAEAVAKAEAKAEAMATA